VIPESRGRGVLVAPWLLLLALVALVAAGCGPAATFDPSGACVVDGRAAGAYPELETLVPRHLDGRAPTAVDSGRSCSDRALGTLAEHDVTEIRYAGAVWDEGDGAGTSIAVIARPDDAGGWANLPIAWVESFYEAGARASSKTSNLETSRPSMGEAGTVWRLDALNDLSQQTVVVRPLGELAQVVLVATRVGPGASLAEHERRVELAVRTAAEAVVPSPE
jgi:hypothetical protein